jgi:hypothetical protein
MMMSIEWNYVSKLWPPRGLLFNPSSCACRTWMESSWQRKNPDLSTRALQQSYQQNHLVARRRNGQREQWIWPCKVFLFIFINYFYMPQNLMTHGLWLYFPSKGRCDVDIYRLSQAWPCKTLGPTASMLTITPPRQMLWC